MLIQKKYKQLISFIKIFNKHIDGNVLVEINQDEYNLLMNFVSSVNNIDPEEPYEPYTSIPLSVLDNYATKDYVDNEIEHIELLKGDTGEIGPQGPKGDTGEAGPKGDNGADAVLPNNIVTSNVDGLQIEVVGSIPETINDNTLYVVQ